MRIEGWLIVVCHHNTAVGTKTYRLHKDGKRMSVEVNYEKLQEDYIGTLREAILIKERAFAVKVKDDFFVVTEHCFHAASRTMGYLCENDSKRYVATVSVALEGEDLKQALREALTEWLETHD